LYYKTCQDITCVSLNISSCWTLSKSCSMYSTYVIWWKLEKLLACCIIKNFYDVHIQAKIKEQPISAEEAHKLKEQEYQLQYAIAQSEQETKRSYQSVAELQMLHNRSIQEIEQARQDINDKLRRITSLIMPWSSILPCPKLPLIDYDTSKRADCEVFKNLMDQAKYLKVYSYIVL